MFAVESKSTFDVEIISQNFQLPQLDISDQAAFTFT